MEISNSPLINLIPTVLGEKSTSRVREVDLVAEKTESSSLQISRVVSEAEKQTARQQLQDQGSPGNNEQNLFRDNPATTQNKAINAYVENQQADQANYLSDVLGVDVYT